MPRFAVPLVLLLGAIPAVGMPATCWAQSDSASTSGGGIGSPGYRFLTAVRDANGDTLMTLLNQPGGTTLVNSRDASTGETALHIVVKRSDATYLRFLLQRGADPNLRDNRGNTPLLLAVTQGDTGMTSLLLDGRANVNQANQGGETPLIRAVQARNLEMVRLLLGRNADPDQRDTMAGLSARDYATRDPRAQTIAAAIAETPRATRGSVAGPHL